MTMVDLMSTGPMTGVDLKSTLAELGVTQSQLALAWGYTEEHVSRWVNGKKLVPAWVPYALGLKYIARAYPKPEPIPSGGPAPVSNPAVLVKNDKPALVTPKKRAEPDDRPFRYMGGRKVYLD